MHKTRLQVFDFDDTLFRIPSYTSKIQVEAMGYGFGGPYEYYDHPISLDESISNIQLISPVYDAWKEGKEDPDCVQILITHRVEEVRSSVESILRARNMDFDQSFFLGRKTPKCVSTAEVMKNLPSLKRIEIYEDSVRQIMEYREFFESYRELDVRIFIVDKSKMYRIEDLKLSEEKRIVLI